MENIRVSICCITYNHVDYIVDALKGFLMQKTNFDYEILIHDDASTDGTTELLLSYQEKYPDKIKLYLEEENQYGKGLIFLPMLFSQARGKYIAYCEGDDFWIYDGKLQEQYDLMESHAEISACYHNAIIWNQSKDNIKLNVMNHPSGYISDEDVICTTRGWYPTASLFMRTEYIKELPAFQGTTGDERWRTYLACRGKLYFINRAWSVYREFVNGGWNTNYYKDKELALNHFKSTILYFKEFNQYSQGMFEKYIKKRLIQGIDKYRAVHYGMNCYASEVRICLRELKNATEHEVDILLDEYYFINIIKCRDYYRSTIEEQVKKNDEIYIYGAGNEAVKALIELDKNNIVPKGFIISDKRNFPSKLLGIPVYGVEEFVFNEDKRIWPCLIDGREEVLEILNNKCCRQIII